MSSPQRCILLVDDDPQLMAVLQSLLTEFSGGQWTVQTANDAATALSVLQNGIVEAVVVDVHMPPIDGVQFLRLIQHRFPGLAKVVLTGDGTGAHRQACLSNGADLYLEKPRLAAGWSGVFAALNQLVRLKVSDSGFRGVLRQVGLQDVLQMECLARNSSLFEITHGAVRGRIYILDGNFIHAEAGERVGEDALNTLLALKHGEFELHAFTEPPQRTISGQWEFLLMEAARRRDESSELLAEQQPGQDLELPTPLSDPSQRATQPWTTDASRGAGLNRITLETRPHINEILLCSVRGDIWHEWQVSKPESRLQMLTLLRHKATQLGEGLALGSAEQLEIEAHSNRCVIHFRPDCALLVRATCSPSGELPLL